MSKPFVAYLRVSTHRQGQSGLGLEAQRESIRQYVESVRGEVVSEHLEVESGRISNRPGLLKSIADCRRLSATLVIARLDRLARNVAFVATLLEGGTEFVAVDAPHANRLMIHVLAAFAEYERDQISARTKAALAAAQERGVKLGTHGAVLAARRKLDALSFAETMVEPIEDARSAGARTLAEIAELLNDRGFLSREGTKWCPTTVHRVLKRTAVSEQRSA